ncbi:MAG TPA: serine/threonine-protein kinase [Planctomycetota bacterium]
MAAGEEADRTMDAARHRRLSELFAEALAKPVEDRAAWLDAACLDDPDLHARVTAMLAADAGRVQPLETPASVLDFEAAVGPAHEPPESVGPFRLGRRIESGGAGAVYEAEQERPRRKVAVKLIRARAQNARQDALLERESELLGRLRHPAVAQVYQAGRQRDARVDFAWLAMELVDGEPITEHCVRAGLDLRERVRLFLRVCAGVDYAHRCGVVHRDLKPAHVLVDRSGNPKILDFGIAGVQGRAGTEPCPVGTPRYMPREQALSASAPDACEDVYALGVILFELLSGEVQPEVTCCSDAEWIDLVRSGGLRPEPEALRRALLPLDLRLIVARALESEPADRYASVAALGADLERWQGNWPVSVRPAGPGYRLRCFARRNRAVTAALAVAGLGLASIAAMSYRFGVQEHGLRTDANAQRQVAQFRALEARRSAYFAHLSSAFAALSEGQPIEARRAFAQAPTGFGLWE